MAAQIVGYTVFISNKDGENAFYTDKYPSPPAGMSASTYEEFVWGQLDDMVSFFTTENPTLAPYTVVFVQRHESEDINLTHP